MSLTLILGKTASAKLDDDSAELWEKTCKGADGRLLRGPFTVAEVDKLFPEGWTPVGRFGVRQSSANSTISCGPSMFTVSAKSIRRLGTLTRLISGRLMS